MTMVVQVFRALTKTSRFDLFLALREAIFLSSQLVKRGPGLPAG